MAYVDGWAFKEELSEVQRQANGLCSVENILKVSAFQRKPSFCVVTKELNKLFSEVTKNVAKCACTVTNFKDSRNDCFLLQTNSPPLVNGGLD